MIPFNSGCDGSEGPPIPPPSNPARNQRDAADREAIENMALTHKFMRRDIQNQSIVDSWLSEYNNNQNKAKRRILELIFHCIDKNKQPLTEDDFLKLESLTLDTFNDWLTEIRLVSSPPDSEFYKKFSKFMQEAFKEPILLNKEFIKAIHVFLSILVRSHWKIARYTATLFAAVMIRIYMHCYQNQPENFDVTIKSRLFQGSRYFMKLINLSLRDVCFFIRKNCVEFYWSLCAKYPAIFLNSSGLRHIYFFLFDRNSQIRLFALKASQFIIHHGNFIEDLERFRSHLLSALTAKCFDKSKEVAVEAIKTLTDFFRKYPEECSGSELETVVPLMFSQEQQIAAKAANLLNLMLLHVQDNAIEFNKQIVNLLEIIENTLSTNCEVMLIRYLLPHAAAQLTDWNAWLELFLGEHLSFKLVEVGCRVFLRIVKCSTTFQLDGDLQFKSIKPLNSLLDQGTQPRLTEEQKYEIEVQQEALTMIFGPNVIQLLDKYKQEPECLKHILKIPQVFVLSDTLELKSIFDYLTRLNVGNLLCLSEAFQTMASILQLMRTSDKWTADIPALEKYIFSFCGNNFLVVCKRLETNKNSNEQTVKSDLIFLKVAYFVTQYFDLTGTELIHNPITALKYGVDKTNIEIMRNTAYLCLHNVHWQLKNIFEKEHSAEERKRREEILRDYVSKIIYLIEPLISFPDSEVLVIDVVNIYSQLCILFSARSVFVSKLPGLKMSALPLLTCEWLNFYLLRHAPPKEVPQDPFKYAIAKLAVEQFCLMLSSGSMDVIYFSSVLPYFFLHDKSKNYNDVLQQVMTNLIVYKDFDGVLIESLAELKRSYTFEELQVVINGVITTGIQKVPVSKVQSFAMSLLTKAIYYICRRNDSMLFPHFLPFVKLLSQQDAEYLLSFVLELDPPLSDDIYVEQFMGGLQSQAHTR